MIKPPYSVSIIKQAVRIVPILRNNLRANGVVLELIRIWQTCHKIIYALDSHFPNFITTTTWKMTWILKGTLFFECI
jgi:hypothetical protein